MGSRAEVSSKSRSRNHDAVSKIERIRFKPETGKTPLERFAEKCAFDPITGCVIWVGGQSKGHGNHDPYGVFWDAENHRKVYAHRWSAEHIHGLNITGLQVDHNCPCGSSTLCVQHVKPETGIVNAMLRHTRPGRGWQDLETRRYWIYVQVGLVTREPIERIASGVPFFQPPKWLVPFMPAMETSDADCPF